MKIRPALRVLAAATATLLLAAGCSQGSATREDSSGGTTTIRYFTFSAAPDHVKDLQKIIDAFQADNPTIKVKVETAPYDQYFTKLQTAIAGGTAPDTFELNYENFVTYASSGALLDLGGPSGKDSSYDAGVFSSQALDAFKASGKQYALPASFSTVVLLYNKKLFDAAGVAYPTPSWTWADEKAAAQKLTAKGVYGDFQPVQFFEFYKTLQQSGGKFFDEGQNKATFNSPQGVEAANWLISKLGKTMPTNEQIGGTPDFDTNLFKSGKLAMWHNGIWQFAGLKDVPFGWDVVVEPGNTHKASAVFQNAAAAAKGTKNPDAAWKWLRYLTSSDVTAQTRVDSSWELPALSDTSKVQGYLDQTPPANRQAVFDSLDAIALTPVIAKQQQMQDIVGKALDNAAAGRVPVQKALDDAASQVDGLLS
jgi:multiple sugar transport system substrate-binding protein